MNLSNNMRLYVSDKLWQILFKKSWEQRLNIENLRKHKKILNVFQGFLQTYSEIGNQSD